MKHLKIEAKIKTMLEEDFNNLDSLRDDKNGYDIAVEKAYNFCVEKEEKLKKARDKIIFSCGKEYLKKEYDFINDINAILIPECNEDLSIVSTGISKRNIEFVVRTKQTNYENDIAKMKSNIEDIINSNVNKILYDNEKLISIDINYEEISIKEFFFNSMKKAKGYGLDVLKFMRAIKEYNYSEEFYSYSNNREDQFIFEYEIKNKLTKEKFYDKYKNLLYNKDFKNEIDRIYNSKNEYKVEINPVHYEFTSYDQDERIKYFEALGTALYSNNRIKNKKIIRILVDISCNYITNDSLLLLLNNCVGSLVFIEFMIHKHSVKFDDREYWGRTQVRTSELTDNINSLKDKVQFAFYVDKYQDKVRDAIIDELEQLNIVRFNDKIMPEKSIDFVKDLAKEQNVEITDRLINEVMMQKDDLTIKDAKTIFEDYKDYIISHKYFPEYKDYYEGVGGVDNYIDPYEKLVSLPGLKNVKETINDIIDFHEVDRYRKEHFIEYKNKEGVKARYNGNNAPMHMIFMGNPGTCKTTVAKLISKIFKSRGITKYDRTEFYGVEGRCVNLENAFKYAYGGILFIDEAYSLDTFNVTKLVALMEEHRKDVIVILAGYTDAMRGFMKRNEGLNSRIKYKIEFEDYNEDELWEILKYQVKENNMTLDDSVKEKVWPIFSSNQCDRELGNGRLVRNILDMAIMKQAKRFRNIGILKNSPDISELNKLTAEDFDIEYKKVTGKSVPKIIGNMDPEIELANMIGIENVKKMLDKIIASAKVNKARREICDGVDTEDSLVASPMHLAFLGNPGSAKTTVARLVARILKKKGIIKKDSIVEVGRQDLVGKYVGWTAPQVESQFEKAKGGILFIDEAYSLVDDRESSFGDEAINTIIQQMENRRDDVIVIFAGYTDRMRKFIDRNEGLRSRLSYILEFDDYNKEELFGIFEKFLNDDKLMITDNAKEKVREIINETTKNKDFGNGRFIRKLIENAKLNMNYRLSKKDGEYTKEELMTLEASDFSDLENDEILDKKQDYAMGFAA